MGRTAGRACVVQSFGGLQQPGRAIPGRQPTRVHLRAQAVGQMTLTLGRGAAGTASGGAGTASEPHAAHPLFGG